MPETTLRADQLRTLPRDVPPGPWDVEGSAMVWVCRPRPALLDVLPPSLRDLRPLVVVGCMVHYDRTPVGPYDEVAAVAILRDGRRRVAHVPFIAVDSAASLVGGRVNWSLPKTMAAFDGRPGAGKAMMASGPGWSVRATARAIGPSLPFRSGTRLRQEAPSGEAGETLARFRGRGRVGRIRVEVGGSDNLRGWLPSGTFPGFIAQRSRGTFPVPTRPS
ncbi:MAG: acetoacetate decarboxylase family protein [Candidatus Dormiibacterota bacterium]